MLLLIGMFLVALNLRPAISSVPPLLQTIRQDLGLGYAPLGLLTTIPVVCMSIFALVAPRISGRIGAERGVLWSVVLIGVATAARLAGAEPIILFATAFLAGVGIAVTQSLLPAIVISRFPHRAALVTGLYTVGIIGGAAVASGASVPLRQLFGGFWPGALASWALLTVVAVALWLPSVLRTRVPERFAPSRMRVSLPWRSGRAWLVSLFFGFQSCIFYSSLTWLAPLYVDQGLGEGRASVLLTLYVLVQIPAAFLISAFADRSEDRRPWLALTLAFTILGLVAVGFIPLAVPWAPWVWMVVLGIGAGGLFSLSLTLPLDNSADPEEADRLTAMTFFVGYLLAAVGPFAVGGLRDATGDYSVPFIALAALSVGMLAVSLRFRPRAS